MAFFSAFLSSSRLPETSFTLFIHAFLERVLIFVLLSASFTPLLISSFMFVLLCFRSTLLLLCAAVQLHFFTFLLFFGAVSLHCSVVLLRVPLVRCTTVVLFLSFCTRLPGTRRLVSHCCAAVVHLSLAAIATSAAVPRAGLFFRVQHRLRM